MESVSDRHAGERRAGRIEWYLKLEPAQQGLCTWTQGQAGGERGGCIEPESEPGGRGPALVGDLCQRPIEVRQWGDGLISVGSGVQCDQHRGRGRPRNLDHRAEEAHLIDSLGDGPPELVGRYSYSVESAVKVDRNRHCSNLCGGLTANRQARHREQRPRMGCGSAFDWAIEYVAEPEAGEHSQRLRLLAAVDE